MKGGMPAMPLDGAPHREIGDPEHNRLGRDRYKYVKRPNVPFLHSAAPQVVLAGAAAPRPRLPRPHASSSRRREPRPSPCRRSTATPRRRPTRTPPTTRWLTTRRSPRCSRSHFSHANGMLPAARHEVEVIQRMREARVSGASCPRSTTPRRPSRRPWKSAQDVG